MTMKITDDELNYWKEREHAYQTSQIASDEVTAKRMAANLKKAKENIQAQINEFYERYAKSEGLTIEEAQKAVSQMDVKAFENKAKEYVANKDFSQQANEQLKLYNATMRINRLELLKAQINLELSQATSANEAIILDSLEKQRVAELKRQAGILGESLGDLQRGLESQTNGDYQLTSFSENLWQNHAEMMSELGNQLRRAVMMGENPAAHASAFQRAFEKTFNQNSFNAKRLLVTETARVQADMQLSAYQTSGYDEYVYIAEPSACKHCVALDGEVFKVSEMEVGRNMFPMHPFCKCSTAPYMSNRQEISNVKNPKHLPINLENIQLFAISDKQAILDKIANEKIDAELFYSRKFAFDEIFKAGVQTPIQKVYNKSDAYYHIINRHAVDWFNDNGINQIVKTLRFPTEIYETTDFFGNRANSYFSKNGDEQLMVIVRNGIITAYKPDTNYADRQKGKGMKIYDSKD